MDCKMTRRPTPPGAILRELYLEPRKVSITAFADAAGVTQKHMSRIVHGHVTLNAEMAARIAEALGTTAQYWLNLQNAVDLYDAAQTVQQTARPPRRMAAFAEAAD